MYSTERGNVDYYTVSHIYRFSIFFMVFIILSFFRIQFWYKFAYIFYFIVLILLISVDFYGVTASGSKRWINLFFINLQPSELMKVALKPNNRPKYNECLLKTFQNQLQSFHLVK